MSINLGMDSTDWKDWLGGFVKNIGICNVYNAEMGGILEVIRLVQERRSKKVEIQVDNIAVVKDIQSGNKCSWHGLSLLSKVKEFEEYSRLTYNSHICVDY